MKILLMPNNIASRMNQNVAILNELGYNTRGLIVNSLKGHSSKKILKLIVL